MTSRSCGKDLQQPPRSTRCKGGARSRKPVLNHSSGPSEFPPDVVDPTHADDLWRQEWSERALRVVGVGGVGTWGILMPRRESGDPGLTLTTLLRPLKDLPLQRNWRNRTTPKIWVSVGVRSVGRVSQGSSTGVGDESSRRGTTPTQTDGRRSGSRAQAEVVFRVVYE